ncbi:MAG: tetratricopeptide repeat protein [Myxococcales bacterium]|nr:tetratricopeptide repeat protein [Myxococcales bacterium]
MYALRPSWFETPVAATTMLLLAQTSLAADTKSAEDWFRDGVELLGQGKLEDATNAFQLCVTFKPDQKECWFNLGVAWGRRRDFAKEAKAYEEALKLDPKYARAHFNVAVALEDLGRQRDALQHYDDAIALDPTAQDALLNRAMLLLSLDRYDEAILGFRRALEVAPDNAEAWYDLGEALQVKGSKSEEPRRSLLLREAIGSFQQCLGKDPGHHRALYNIGVVHHKLKELDAEIGAYQKALALKPRYTAALYNLSFALRDKGDRDGAKVALARYLDVAAKLKAEERFVEQARKELAKYGP